MKINMEISDYAYAVAKESAEMVNRSVEYVIDDVLYEWAKGIRKYGRPLKIEYAHGVASQEEREKYLEVIERQSKGAVLYDEDIEEALEGEGNKIKESRNDCLDDFYLEE